MSGAGWTPAAMLLPPVSPPEPTWLPIWLRGLWEGQWQRRPQSARNMTGAATHNRQFTIRSKPKRRHRANHLLRQQGAPSSSTPLIRSCTPGSLFSLPVVQDRQIHPPRPDSIHVYFCHRPCNLPQVVQVMRNPRRQQLPQRDLS
jgi:hypothetical protein